MPDLRQSDADDRPGGAGDGSDPGDTRATGVVEETVVVAAPGSPAVTTPAERHELLSANRRNREKERERLDAKARREEAKEAKRSAKAAGLAEPATVTIRRPWAFGAAAVVVLLVVAVGVLTYLYLGERGKTDTSGDTSAAVSVDAPAIDAATEYAETVLSYEWGDYADLDRRIREFSTPEFADTFLAQAAEPRRANDEAQASVVSEAVGAGLVSQDDDRAEVLIAIDRTVTSPQLESIPQGDLQQGRVMVTLEKSADRWLLAGLRNV